MCKEVQSSDGKIQLFKTLMADISKFYTYNHSFILKKKRLLILWRWFSLYMTSNYGRK